MALALKADDLAPLERHRVRHEPRRGCSNACSPVSVAGIQIRCRRLPKPSSAKLLQREEKSHALYVSVHRLSAGAD
jgi:hypothetical protein